MINFHFAKQHAIFKFSFKWTLNSRIIKKAREMMHVVLEHAIRWASLDSSWVWATNSDPMHHQRFLYFSSLFFLLLSVSAVESCPCHSMISSLQWGQWGATYSCLHPSQQPGEIMIISNAPNYINTMLNFPWKTDSNVKNFADTAVTSILICELQKIMVWLI